MSADGTEFWHFGKVRECPLLQAATVCHGTITGRSRALTATMIAVWLAAGVTDRLAGTIKHWVVNPRAVP
jgi:hypothetical protein